jgi:murein DD-endopeptidase MepM/ murein hydrolase activator NlpD
MVAASGGPGSLTPCRVRVPMPAAALGVASWRCLRHGSWPQGWKRIARGASYQRLILARHLSMPSFMTGKRSRLITIAAAGTVTLATAVSATAAALPSSSAAVSAGAADSRVLVAKQHQVVARAAHGAMVSETMSEEQQMILTTRARYVRAERQREYQAALARAAAARKAAAAKAAARAAAAGAAAKTAAARQAAAAKAAAKQRAAQQQAASAPSGSPQQIAEQMLSQFGWSSGQFSCLQPLWAHESGWNPYAQNPSSGAYGIPQALPGSKMASAGGDWQSNPATQIRWGLSYIQGNYGSPCGAWAHEQATGWY